MDGLKKQPFATLNRNLNFVQAVSLELLEVTVVCADRYTYPVAVYNHDAECCLPKTQQQKRISGVVMQANGRRTPWRRLFGHQSKYNAVSRGRYGRRRGWIDVKIASSVTRDRVVEWTPRYRRRTGGQGRVDQRTRGDGRGHGKRLMNSPETMNAAPLSTDDQYRRLL